MIAKKRLPEGFEYYTDGMNTAEEVELFFKLFQHGKVENLPNYLLFYRIHSKNTSFSNIKTTFLLTLLARIKAVFLYNYKPSFMGIVITVLQSIIVFTLPKPMIMLFYKAIRKFYQYKKLTLFSFKKTSIDKAISL